MMLSSLIAALPKFFPISMNVGKEPVVKPGIKNKKRSDEKRLNEERKGDKRRE